MKFITTLLALFVSFSVLANTNSSGELEDVKKQAVQTVQTNLNQVLIDILSGVKDASGEIYDASKNAIGKSVDFAVEQAPDVVKQFLKWKLCESILYGLTGLVFAIFLMWLAVRCWRWGTKQNDDEGFMGGMGSVICWVAAFLILFNVTLRHTANTVKIAVAPKVYIIEYVVDVLKPNTNKK